jgi:hypothetical protein
MNVRVRGHIAPLVLAVSVLGGCEGKRGPADVAVPAATTVVVTPSTKALVFGEQVTLQAQTYDQNGVVMPGVQVSWSSNAPGVVAVDGSGHVEAKGVGTGRVTARVGSAEGSAEFTVDPAERTLVEAPLAASGYGFVSVTLPTGAIAEDGQFEGRIGEASVVFSVTGRTLSFVAPGLAAGVYPGRVSLNANEVGTFSISLSAAPEVANPVATVTTMVGNLRDAITGGGNGSATALAALDAFSTRFAALPPQGQAEVARMMAANPTAFTLLQWSEVQSLATRAATTSDDAELNQVVQSVRQHVNELESGAESALVPVRTCGMKPEGYVCEVALVSAASFSQNMDLSSRLIRWAKEKIREYATDPNAKPKATRLSVWGVRGSPPSHPVGAAAMMADGSPVHRMLGGSSYALEMDLEFRTPTAAEASQGPLAPFGSALADLGNLWARSNSYLTAMSPIVNVQLGLGPAPSLPSPPSTEVLTAKARHLALAGVSDPRVSCTGSHVEGDFRLICNTTATQPVRFTADIRYATPLSTVTHPIEVEVEPLRLVLASGAALPDEVIFQNNTSQGFRLVDAQGQEPADVDYFRVSIRDISNPAVTGSSGKYGIGNSPLSGALSLMLRTTEPEDQKVTFTVYYHGQPIQTVSAEVRTLKVYTLVGYDGGSLPHTFHPGDPDAEVTVHSGSIELRPSLTFTLTEVLSFPEAPSLRYHWTRSGSYTIDGQGNITLGSGSRPWRGTIDSETLQFVEIGDEWTLTYRFKRHRPSAAEAAEISVGMSMPLPAELLERLESRGRR